MSDQCDTSWAPATALAISHLQPSQGHIPGPAGPGDSSAEAAALSQLCHPAAGATLCAHLGKEKPNLITETEVYAYSLSLFLRGQHGLKLLTR